MVCAGVLATTAMFVSLDDFYVDSDIRSCYNSGPMIG